MNIQLQVFLVVGILIYLTIILSLLKKKKLNLKYTLLWLLTAVVMFIASLCPSLVSGLSKLVGVNLPVNFVFMLWGLFVLLILLSLTVIVSHVNERIYKLVQTQAILEKRIRELETEINNKENGEK